MLFLQIKIFCAVSGIALIVLGFCMAGALMTLPPAPLALEQVLDSLPDHDGTASARRLMAEKKYGEARILCQDILENDLPGKKAAGLIIQMCDSKLYPVEERLWKMAEAFITGNPGESIEQAGSAMLSDMMMYGDIRDLILQGYYRMTGRETDPWVIAFAAAGLVTEAFDTVDWMPAFFKALRRAGALSDKMAAGIISAVRNGGRYAGNAGNISRQLSGIFLQSGVIRSKNIFRHLNRVDDIVLTTKMTKKSVSATHLLARNAGKDTPALFKKLIREKRSKTFIRKLLTKGPRGTTLFLRFSKSVEKGTAGVFFRRVLRLLKDFYGTAVWLIPLSLIISGLLLNWKILRKCVRIFRKKAGIRQE